MHRVKESIKLEIVVHITGWRNNHVISSWYRSLSDYQFSQHNSRVFIGSGWENKGSDLRGKSQSARYWEKANQSARDMEKKPISVRYGQKPIRTRVTWQEANPSARYMVESQSKRNRSERALYGRKPINQSARFMARSQSIRARVIWQEANQSERALYGKKQINQSARYMAGSQSIRARVIWQEANQSARYITAA